MRIVFLKEFKRVPESSACQGPQHMEILPRLSFLKWWLLLLLFSR